MNNPSEFPSLLETFFTDRLMRQRRASPHTIAPIATRSACCSLTPGRSCVGLPPR